MLYVILILVFVAVVFFGVLREEPRKRQLHTNDDRGRHHQQQQQQLHGLSSVLSPPRSEYNNRTKTKSSIYVNMYISTYERGEQFISLIDLLEFRKFKSNLHF